MKVHMIGQISGTRDGKAWPAPGGVIELPDDEAKSLIAAKLARKFQVVEGVVERADAPTDKVEKRKGMTRKSLGGD